MENTPVMQNSLIGLSVSALATISSITVQEVNHVIAGTAGITGIIAAVYTIMISREKYILMKKARKFDRSKCFDSCDLKWCQDNGCRAAYVLQKDARKKVDQDED